MKILYMFITLFMCMTGYVFAQQETGEVSQEINNLDSLLIIIATFLVFFMQLGFSMVEAGFTRAKNAVNIILKNMMDFSIGMLAFFAIGFGLMFGITKFGLFGTEGFFLSNWEIGENYILTFWIFHAVFAATSTTIVSGSIAERVNFRAYLLFSFIMTGFIYSIFGHWAWGSLFHGNGWLERLGFIDFAGGTVVHSVGAWAGLAGAVVLGPRIGKFSPDGRARPIPGHNIPIAAIGVFILWFGWFGFNAGSNMKVNSLLSLIVINTAITPAVSSVIALFVIYYKYKKFEPTLCLNAVLAGAVAITPGAGYVTPYCAILIGIVAGILIVYSVLFFEEIGIDDPVGAISVHGVCGAWGTLAAGMFHYDFVKDIWSPIIIPQIIGIIVAFIWSFGVSLAAFKLLDKIIKVRVSKEEEWIGLDFTEHGITAYPEFQETRIK